MLWLCSSQVLVEIDRGFGICDMGWELPVASHSYRHRALFPIFSRGMNVRSMLAFVILLGFVPLQSEETEVLIVRDMLVPPATFEDKITRKALDPREHLSAERITLGEEESIAYDPATMRLFVRARPATIHRIEVYIQAERERFAALVSITYQVFETRKSLLSEADAPPGDPAKDPDSGARILKGEDEAAPVMPALSATKIFAKGDQVDSLIRRVRAANLGKIRPLSTVVAQSGQTMEAWTGDALIRAVPVIAADASSAEMTLTLLQGRAGADPKIVGETKLTIFSGGTIAFEERLGETSWRTRLVTVVVVDAAGDPIVRREAALLPGEDQREPSGALFPGPVPEPAIEKVKAIIIPSIDFKDTPLLEAIEILNKAGVEHDKSLPESQRGVKIRFVDSRIKDVENVRITLRLSNVTLEDAIRYTAALANCEYAFKGDTVEIGTFLKSSHVEVDGSDIWYVAFLRLREADKLEGSGDVAGARSRRLQALTLCEVISAKYPGFHPEIVKDRIKLLRKMLAVE